MPESRGPVVAVALVTLLAALAVAAESPAPPKGSPEQKKTITDIRNVGTAMFAWYKAQPRPKHAGDRKIDTDKAPFGEVPAISREELAKLLVPKYIPEIPGEDGWGHPYEFHLNTANLDADRIMGLRSAGQDGKFSGDVYEVSAFAPDDQAQDIAWMDGYFVRWPQAKEAR